MIVSALCLASQLSPATPLTPPVTPPLTATASAITTDERPIIDIRISDSRNSNIYLDTLRWLLKRSGERYQLRHTDHPISSQKRKVAMLLNDEIDIIYAGTTTELEDTLRPIRFPITRGHIGQRLLVINKIHQAVFRQINNLADLQQHTALLGFGWPEVELFSAAQMPISERVYDDIFLAVNDGSRAYFPRGVLEASAELTDRPYLANLAIDSHLLLRYKSAVFFFVHPDNQKLADLITREFSRAYRDGSYIDFFYNHPGVQQALAAAQLNRRTVIDIDNPFFPEASNNIPAQYWYP